MISRGIVNLAFSAQTEFSVATTSKRLSPQQPQAHESISPEIRVLLVHPVYLLSLTSEGMLFDIGYADGITPVLVTPEAHVPDGTRAG